MSPPPPPSDLMFEKVKRKFNISWLASTDDIQEVKYKKKIMLI